MVISPHELKKRRDNLNLTQKEFAKRIGVSQSIISKFESEKSFPNYKTIKTIEDNLVILEKEDLRKVEEIMNKDIFYAYKEMKVKEIVNEFKKSGYSQAPVMDKENHKIIGVIRAVNLIDEDKEKKVSECKLDEVPTIPQNCTIENAKYGLKHFPMIIVSNAGKVVGIITRSDIL
ncbi:MAG: CBS domain-containing protein [Candidatus Woesearchaeota archaeon]